jgi:hypothetical protein
MIPSLLSHMSPKEPPTNTLITINPLFFESSMKQWSREREMEMEPGGIPSLLSHMSPKEPPTNTLITINPLFFESSMKQWSRERERWRWSLEVRSSHGNDGLIGFGNQERMVSKRAVPCAQAVVRISLTDMLISYIKTTTDTFFLPGQIWLGFS